MKRTGKEQQEIGQPQGTDRTKSYWAVLPVALFLLCAAVLYLAAGDSAQIGIADNLDLFQAQYQMLKNTDTFTAQGASAPFLHGVSRDVLPGEFSVEALLYRVFPPLGAYLLMYFFKVILAVISFVLLAKELDQRGLLSRNPEEKALRNLTVLGGFAYGILNLFPSFGISFASVPLLVWMVLRLERAEGSLNVTSVLVHRLPHSAKLPLRILTQGDIKMALWLAGIFCYPLLSYFSYFGIFLLGYLAAAFLGKSIRDSVRRRRVSLDFRLLAATVVLALGYMTFEYRLFRQMLLANEPTIRDTMVQTTLGGKEILQWILDVLINGVGLHCESAHRFIVLPVCLVYWIVLNVGYLRRKEGRKAFCDLYNLAVLILIFNSVIYGLYYCGPFRSFVEKLVPPLKGFQFSRTVFFNPFLWYGMFTIALQRLYVRLAGSDRVSRSGRKRGFLVWGLMAAAIFSILLYGNSYNDLLHTAKSETRKVMGIEPEDTLSYGEFYSTELFGQACRQIGYEGEWAVAYGFHPAVLEYNGIATLDGYLGFYSQSYKEEFRKVIAPALSMNEGARSYYDEWGARCYLYSADQPTIVEAVRNYPHPEGSIAIDPNALRELGCKYIFSRVCITNVKEMQLKLCCTCTDETSPYTLYVYRLEDDGTESRSSSG